MAQPKRDRFALREAWIQERLGERKYQQLRMHLSGALKLLGELGVVHEIQSPTAAVEVEVPQDLDPAAAKAVAALMEHLRALSPGERTIAIREIKLVKR